MRLFLSYSRKDRKIIDELAAVLRNGGQEVWIDNQIRTGTQWRVALREAIEQSDGIVLALTSNWIASPYCQWEFITAAELGKKIIPVLLSETDIPARISQYQYAKFVDGFTDADRVQQFLDDLLVLAAEIDIDAVDMSSKIELERQIDQQIQTGNITDSTIDATQKSNGTDNSGSQGIATGDISGSTITFNQETTTIGSQTIQQREKQRNWTIPVIVGLLLALISTIAAIVALLPETQRENLLYDVGLVPASATPPPTATTTPSPTPSPTATPSRMPANAFNVVVAGFGYLKSDGSISEDNLANDLSDIVFDSIRQLPQIDNIRGWRSTGVGHILGSTPTERESQAAILAQTLNADVVIYGIVTSDDIFVTFEPEFYLAAEFASLEPELVGADVFGDAVEFVAGADDQLSAATDLQRRLSTLRLFIRGLALYIIGLFEEAETAFVQAFEITEDDGLEVLYIFAGNSAARIPDYEASIDHYGHALQIRPTYARALLGRGSVIYHMALVEAGDDPPPYNPSLELDTKLDCRDIEAELPTSPQLLGELAVRCYNEAQQSVDQPDTSDIDIKVAFALGQVYLWLSINEYKDSWDEAQEQLELVIRLYETSDEARQARIRAMAAHAHAWLGLKLLTLEGTDMESVSLARDHYNTAVGLLRQDVNRTYNQSWIDIYVEQISSLDNWLEERN